MRCLPCDDVAVLLCGVASSACKDGIQLESNALHPGSLEYLLSTCLSCHASFEGKTLYLGKFFSFDQFLLSSDAAFRVRPFELARLGTSDQ